jgi:hypothetical protein
MAVTAYSVFYDYDFGPNYLRNVAIMNIGSVDPNFTGSRALAGPEMHNLLLDQETFGTQADFYYQAKQTNQKFAYNLLDFTYKNFDALDKSSTNLIWN